VSFAPIAALFIAATAPTPGSVAHFPTRAPERVPTPVVAEIDAAIDAALGQAGRTVVRVETACADEACYADAVARAGADAGVVVGLDATGSDYSISVTLVDAAGKSLATKEAACEICTHPDLVERAGELVGEAAAALPSVEEPEEAGPARLSVVSSPSGATVLVDGVKVGVTPWSGEVEPGSRTIRVESKGRQPAERMVEAVVGVERDEAFELERKGMRIDPETEVTIGWVALGVGLAAVVAGAALIAVDENEIKSDCEGANVDANGVCKYRRNTLGGGVTLLVVGVAATGTGVGLVVHGYKRRGPKREVALGPGSLRVRF
jgi:hypothetical protein